VPSTSSSAQQARQALGLRLRELRVDAGLTAHDLAGRMGRHPAKISRVEHGNAVPSADDIREWCLHCGANEQVTDLIASLRAVEGMWIEWRRMEGGGLRRAQAAVLPLYERTRVFRAYSPGLMPGLVQTPEYTTAVLASLGRRRRLPDDVAEAVAVRMERQKILHHGDHRLLILMEESALSNGVGGVHVMIGQLGKLIAVAALPRVSLGIVPAGADRDATTWPVEDFWIFDREQVAVELVSGFLTITQPREIAMYEQIFGELGEIAVFGADARVLITAAITAFERQI
jgi:transcriptional regulator with XRE-family HTH domain